MKFKIILDKIKKIQSSKFPVKEAVLICISVLYILYQSFKNRGTTYLYKGLSAKDTRRIASIPSSREEQCRNIFEKIFQVPFIKQRPEWLVNPKTNYKLELDGYADIPTPMGRGIAFEYNGQQHYEFKPKFHENVEEFENQKFRDITKIEKCKDKGVLLIVIPYIVKDLEKFIRKQLLLNDLHYYL